MTTSVAPLPFPPDLCALEALAQPALTPMAWDYIRGGAAGELTLKRNRSAFDELRLKPRALCDVSHLRTELQLFGQALPCPILLAPTAYHQLFHREGEIASVRGANAAGAAAIISSFATIAIEEITRAASLPVWFQLYVNPDRNFTRALIERVERAGCTALCLTVDTPVIGCRYREVDFKLPPGLACPNAMGLDEEIVAAHRPTRHEIYSPILDASFTWRGLDWLRSITRLPILLKGVLNPEDAARAVEAGVAGIIVSNHGGRNLDTVPATIEALPPIAQAVAGRIPLLLDGGIRRGTDVLKALALGASATLIGRPYLYGLALAGAAGVEAVVCALRREFEMAMALTGCSSLAGIDQTVLWP